MSTTTDESISVLNELIAICEDGAKGYAKAAEDVTTPVLKDLFLKYAAQRGSFSAELKSEVAALGEKPDESGHITAAFHRAWMSLKEAVGNKDKAIIDECEAGEDSAMKAYKQALEKPISAAAFHLIKTQFAGIIEAHGKLRDLKLSTN
jgi:uncharacterized protein (TIGR02284 family)